MTVISSQIKPEISNTQDKPEASLEQQKVDTNLDIKNEVKKEQSISAETSEDPNWRAFREARKKDRLEKEAAEKRAIEKEAEVTALKAAMEAAFSKSAPSPQSYQQYYGNQTSYDQEEETEDQRIEKKVNALLIAKEERARKESVEREQKEYPNRLMKDLPDFNHVVSQENLDYIDFHYPEVSRPLQRLSDGYEKWSDIYHAIRKFVPNHSSAKKEAAKADANHQKPKSISSTSITQSGGNVSHTIIEVEQRRAANWERMQRLIKGI